MSSRWIVSFAQPEDQEHCCLIDKIMGFETEQNIHQQAIREQRTLIARSENQIAGYLRYGFLWDGELPVIQMIRVIPDGQRQGCGKALVLALEQHLKQRHPSLLLSSTDDTNRNSLLFHRSLGFQECGRLAINPGDRWEIFLKKTLQ